MSSISGGVSAWNEEGKIERCLASAKWANELIVVDNSSIDKTPHVAKKMGATVFTRPNNPMLNINKNFGFEKASSDWILCLDADEQLTGLRERHETILKRRAASDWNNKKLILCLRSVNRRRK